MVTAARLPAKGQLADVLLPGGLGSFIDTRRAAGMSWAHIARDVWVVTGGDVDVSVATLRSWVDRLPARTNGAA